MSRYAMSRSFNEEHLRFEFGESWTVEKYDEHAAYRKGIEKLDGSKAVDFIGVRPNGDLYLIEVTDFRGYQIAGKQQLCSGQLVREVGFKVRYSIAGVVGAHRNSEDVKLWEPYVASLVDRGRRVLIVLWIEGDIAATLSASMRRGKTRGKRQKSAAQTLGNLLKRNTCWLTKRVFVVSQVEEGYQHVLPDLAVSNLPGAGRP